MFNPWYVCLSFNHFKMSIISHLWQAAQTHPIEIQRQQEMRRRKRAREQFRTMTPEALQGRKHIEIQTGQAFLWTTSEQIYHEFVRYAVGSQIQLIIIWPLCSELYLEELSNVIVATDTECQTDAFLDKPATPLFIPAKSGKDVDTQIEEGEVGDPNGTSGDSLQALHFQDL